MMYAETNREQSINAVAVAVFLVLTAINVLLVVFGITGISVAVAGFIITSSITASIRIANQWEKAVILRMGKYIGVMGTGIFFIVPIID